MNLVEEKWRLIRESNSATLGEAIGAILFAEQKQNEAKLDQNFLQVNC